MLLSSEQIELAGEAYALTIVIDITERKQMEQALRRSQQKYANLVNSLDGIVWEADAQTFQFTFASQQAERLLGYPIEYWLTKPTFWKDHIHPDDQEWAIDLCVKSTQQKRPHNFEYRMLAADGRVDIQNLAPAVESVTLVNGSGARTR